MISLENHAVVCLVERELMTQGPIGHAARNLRVKTKRTKENISLLLCLLQKCFRRSCCTSHTILIALHLELKKKCARKVLSLLQLGDYESLKPL